MIKALEDFGVEIITDICNDIYNAGYMQRDLRTSIFFTIPDMISAVEFSDFRIINLMCHVTKVLLKVLQE
jgi:hypothetical protein